MALFNIVVDIAARTADLESGIDRVTTKLQSFGDSVKHIGEIVAGSALVEFGKQIIELGSRLEIASEKANVSGQAFSELAYAAKQNGIGIDTLSQALVKMEQALSNAGTGAKRPNDALAALGLTFTQLKSLTPELQLETIADRISRLASPADKARAEIELFGRSGAELGPLLAQGAAGIEKLRQEAIDVGAAFSDQTLKNLDETRKSIDRMESSFAGLAATLIGKVSPALTTVLDRLSGAISGDRVQQLKQEIEFLQQVQGEPFASLGLSTYSDIGTGVFSSAQGAQKLQALQNMLAVAQGQRSGASAGFFKDYNDAFQAAPPGYQPNDPLTELHFDKSKISGMSDNGQLSGFFADYQNVFLTQLQDQLKTYADANGGSSGTAPAKLLAEWEQQTRTSLESAQTEFDQTKVKLQELLASGPNNGGIGTDTFNQRMKEAGEKLESALNVEPVILNLHKLPEIMSKGSQAVNDFTDDVKSALQNTVDETGNFGKNLLKNLLQAFESRELFKAIDNIGAAIARALDPTGTGEGFGGILAGIFGGSGNSINDLGTSGGVYDTSDTSALLSNLDGFATGGSFTVGGRGGTDQNLVAFRATQGEQVNVSRPGQSSRSSPVINITNNIDARGATTDLLKSLPAVLKQNNDALEYKIVTGLKRNAYAV